MSGIFGLFERQGRSVVPAELLAMRDQMAHWGPDGTGHWCEGSAGLGSLRLHNTPESVHEILPRKSTDGRFVLTAEARLDNRDELCDSFSIPLSQRPTVPDGQLILQAYETWGENCLQRLLGDWSFAVWHPREQRLFLARDQHGITSLYYFVNERRIAFASDQSALLALTDAPRQLNELYLGQLLVACPAREKFETIRRDLNRLSPAHALSVTRERHRTWRYWFLEDSPDLQFRSEDDLGEQFLQHYMQAVRARLRSVRPLGVTLSGGLDSGSVTSLAGEALTMDNRGALTAFTSVPRFTSESYNAARRFGNEWPFASAVAQAAGLTSHVAIDGGQVSPLQGLRRGIAVHHTPCHAGGNQFWIFDLLDQAQQRGIGTMLTGQGGNPSVSWTGLPPRERIRQAWRNGHYCIAAKRLAKNLLPKTWRSRLKILRSTGELRNIDQPWRLHSAIRPQFARRLRLAECMIDAGFDRHPFDKFPNARDARLAMIQPGTAIVGEFWAHHGAQAGMEVRDPTQDIRLLEFCLGVPDHFYRSPEGMNRWVLRRAMAGRMPDEVRLNQKLGRQATDIVARVQQTREEIEAEFASVARSPIAAEYLDLPYMRRSLDSILRQDTASTKQLCDTIFLRGLMAGMFLRDSAMSAQIPAQTRFSPSALPKPKFRDDNCSTDVSSVQVFSDGLEVRLTSC